ncbi:MAG: hypothetical protein HQ530_02810 [Parcubacteria group bacterium]|nr:hypothetical protein [Parcubacteria group bacterium]
MFRESPRSPEETRELLNDLTYLPSREEILQVFGLKGGQDDFYKYCREDYEMYEIPTREFVADLGGYLEKRMTSLGSSPDNPITILGLGDGDGRLSHFLKQYLAERMSGEFNIIAVDNGSYGIEPVFPVEYMECEEAIDRYQPGIAISAWPGGHWQPKLRNTESVQEYIYIGEPFVFIGNDEEEIGEHTEECRQDGFIVEEFDEFRQHQVCFTDFPCTMNETDRSHSCTYSFRKEEQVGLGRNKSGSKPEKPHRQVPKNEQRDLQQDPEREKKKRYNLKKEIKKKLKKGKEKIKDSDIRLFRIKPVKNANDRKAETGIMEFSFGVARFTARYEKEPKKKVDITVERVVYGDKNGKLAGRQRITEEERKLLKSSGFKKVLRRKYQQLKEEPGILHI